MDGWRGLLVLTIGLAIGAALWFGVVGLVEPSGSLVQTARAGAAQAGSGQGVSAATTASADEEEEPPPEPFVVSVKASELQVALETAPFVHRGYTGPPLYVVTYRNCPACIEFKNNERAMLESASVDIRWLVYARRDGEGIERSGAPERAMVAELALNRSFALMEAWFTPVTAEEYYHTAKLPPDAESSSLRKAALEKTRTFIDALSEITEANGQELGIPSFFWRDFAGAWHGMVGYDPDVFPQVTAGLFPYTQAPLANSIPRITLPAPQ